MLVFCGGCADAACLQYADATISGTLTRQTFAGPPNFESIAAGDAPVTRLVLVPDRPHCVARGTAPGLEPAVRRAQAFQLEDADIAADSASPSPWDLVQRRVTCSGSLSHQRTARDYSQVILHARACVLDAQP